MKYNKDGVRPPNLKAPKPKVKGGSCCGSSKTKGDMDYAYGADVPSGRVSAEGPDANIRGPHANVDVRKPKAKGGSCCGSSKTKGDMDYAYGGDGPQGRASVEAPGVNVKGPNGKPKKKKGGLSCCTSSNKTDDKDFRYGAPSGTLSGPSVGGDIDRPDVDINAPSGSFSGGIQNPSFNYNVDGPKIREIDVPVGNINVKGPDVDVPNLKTDVDIDKPDAKGPGFKGPSWKLKKPNIDMPEWNLKKKGVDIDGPDMDAPSVDLQVDTPDMSVKGPDFDADIEAPKLDGDVDIGSPDAKVKGPGWKFKKPDISMPDINMPSWGSKKKGVDIDGPDVDLEGPNIKGPSIEGPDIDGDVDIGSPDAKVKGPGWKFKKPDISMPDINMPGWGGKKKGVDIDGPDVDLEGPNIKGPSIEGPDIDGDVDIKSPDAKVKGPGWKFKKPDISMPDINMPSWGGKKKGVDIDGPDMDAPSVDLQVDTPDMSVKGPDFDADIETPKFDGDVNIGSPDAKVKGPGWKFKKPDISMPDINMPSWGGKKKGVDIDGPDVDLEGPNVKGPSIEGPDIDGDVDFESPDAKVKGPGWKFKKPDISMPDINMPSWGGKKKGVDIDGPDMDASIKGPDVNIDGPDVDVPSSDSKFRGPSWKFKKPDLHLPEWKSKKKSYDLPNLDGPDLKADFESPSIEGSSIRSPEIESDVGFKGPSFGGGLRGPEVNIGTPGFSTPKSNVDADLPSFDSSGPSAEGSFGISGPSIGMPDVGFDGPDNDVMFEVDAGDLETAPGGDLDGEFMLSEDEKGNLKLSKPTISGPDVDLNIKKKGSSSSSSSSDDEDKKKSGKYRIKRKSKKGSSSSSSSSSSDSSDDEGKSKGFSLGLEMPSWKKGKEEDKDLKLDAPSFDAKKKDKDHDTSSSSSDDEEKSKGKFGIKLPSWKKDDKEQDKGINFDAPSINLKSNKKDDTSSSSSSDDEEKSKNKFGIKLPSWKKDDKEQDKGTNFDAPSINLKSNKKDDTSSSSSSDDEDKSNRFGFKLPSWKKDKDDKDIDINAPSLDVNTKLSRPELPKATVQLPATPDLSADLGDEIRPEEKEIVLSEPDFSSFLEPDGEYSVNSSSPTFHLPSNINIDHDASLDVSIPEMGKPKETIIDRPEISEEINPEEKEIVLSAPDFSSFLETDDSVIASPDTSDRSISVEIPPAEEKPSQVSSPTSPLSPRADPKLWDIVQGYIDTEGEEGSRPRRTMDRDERGKRSRSLPSRAPSKTLSVDIDDINDPWTKHYLGERRGTGSSLGRPSSTEPKAEKPTVSPSLVFAKIPHVRSPLNSGSDMQVKAQDSEERRRSLKALGGAPTKRLHNNMFQFQDKPEERKEIPERSSRDSRKYLWDMDGAKASATAKPRSRSTPPTSSRGLTPVNVSIPIDDKPASKPLAITGSASDSVSVSSRRRGKDDKDVPERMSIKERRALFEK